MHAGDGLHHSAVAQAQSLPIDGFHLADMRVAELSDRDVRVALDGAWHAGRPQQLIIEVAINELTQIEQVLQQFPARGERGSHQLDEALRVVGRDVLVRERRAEPSRMRRLRKLSGRCDPQRFFLDALAPPLQNLRLTTVDERGKPPFEGAIDTESSHAPSSTCCSASVWASCRLAGRSCNYRKERDTRLESLVVQGCIGWKHST